MESNHEHSIVNEIESNRERSVSLHNNPDCLLIAKSQHNILLSESFQFKNTLKVKGFK